MEICVLVNLYFNKFFVFRFRVRNVDRIGVIFVFDYVIKLVLYLEFWVFKVERNFRKWLDIVDKIFLNFVVCRMFLVGCLGI